MTLIKYARMFRLFFIFIVFFKFAFVQYYIYLCLSLIERFWWKTPLQRKWSNWLFCIQTKYGKRQLYIHLSSI
jgi:hypothetical protein